MRIRLSILLVVLVVLPLVTHGVAAIGRLQALTQPLWLLLLVLWEIAGRLQLVSTQVGGIAPSRPSITAAVDGSR